MVVPVPNKRSSERGVVMVEMTITVLPMVLYLAFALILSLGMLSTCLVAQDALYAYVASVSEKKNVTPPTLSQLFIGHPNQQSVIAAFQSQSPQPFGSTNADHLHFVNFVAGEASRRHEAFGHPETTASFNDIRYPVTTVRIQDIAGGGRRNVVARYFFPLLFNYAVSATIISAP